MPRDLGLVVLCPQAAPQVFLPVLPPAKQPASWSLGWNVTLARPRQQPLPQLPSGQRGSTAAHRTLGRLSSKERRAVLLPQAVRRQAAASWNSACLEEPRLPRGTPPAE